MPLADCTSLATDIGFQLRIRQRACGGQLEQALKRRAVQMILLRTLSCMAQAFAHRLQASGVGFEFFGLFHQHLSIDAQVDQHASNDFRFAGGDWKATKDLTLQYYYANLENYYTQNFVGLVHVLPLGNDQSFKTDLRYFDSRADGKNGEAGYRFNNNNGFAKDPGEVNNKTWSAMFTYSLGEHAFLLGRQEVNDDGGFVWLNQANVTDDRKRPEGNGGTAFYLFTDAMIGNFARAGAKTNFGQYAYSFAKLGIPGLKASVSYMNGNGIKDIKGGSDHSEWERDARVDYVIPNGPLKGFGTTLRHGTYRGDNSAIADQDQTRLIFNYSYSFL